MKSYDGMARGFDVTAFRWKFDARFGSVPLSVGRKWGRDARRLIENILAADTHIRGEFAVAR